MVALDSFYPMTGVTEQLAQWQKFAPNYTSDGVINNTLSSFTVGQHTAPNMSVDVATGQCFIQGVFGESGSIKTLTITGADATNPRIDRVVLRCDTVAQDLEVLVLTGVAAVSPSPPALIRSATQTDYSLCQVLVGTTVTSIVTANITDERVFSGPRSFTWGRIVASSGTIQPLGVLPLTDGWQECTISGTVTIANIAVGNTPPRPGQMILLDFINVGCTVNASGGNMKMSRAYISGVTAATLLLIWDGSGWVDLARSGEQAPAHQYYGNPTGTVAAATFASIVAADLPTYGTFAVASVTQGGTTVSFTTTSARFTQFGKTAHAYCNLLMTSAGTAGAAVLVTLPASLTLAGNQGNIGIGTVNRGGLVYVGAVVPASTTSFNIISTSQSNFLGATPSFALGSADQITAMITAELA